MVKFTEGPWDYFVGNSNGRGLIRIEAGNDSPVAGKHIASMPRGGESEANARLIAAAPNLLAAARHLLTVGEFCRTDDTESAVRQLRAAVAKAEADDPTPTKGGDLG